MERRDFLQQAGLGLGATAMGMTAAASTPVSPASAAEGPRNEPLNATNTAVLIVDHQIGLYTGVRDIPVSELKHNVVALVKAAKVLKLPVIAMTTASATLWGPVIPELAEALGGIEITDRSVVNAWDEPRIVRAVEATGRKNLIIAGVSLEVCVAFPAMSALRAGYRTYAAVDASGTFSETKRATGLLRMTQAGVVVADYASLMVEVMKDNAHPDAGAVYGALDMPFAGLVGQLSSAYAKRKG